ncbi:DUF2953 domain-containing protein [Paenibacillus sp. KN14-4R]|uniref:DUF2953 domain-containing protein n=1 Tax=Paenibacillus sp. KN14-4R TaxID=3445773 RepID=UPI003FA0216A
MGWLLWIIGILIGLCLLLFVLSCTYVEGKMHIRRVKNNDSFTFEFKALFGLIRHRFEVPIVDFMNMSQGIKVKSKEVNANSHKTVGKKKTSITRRGLSRSIHNTRMILQQTRDLNRWLIQTLSTIKCSYFQWDSRIGIGDAPNTAMAVGVLWAVKTSLLGWVFRYIQLQSPPKLSVNPQYNQTTYSTEILVTLKTRIFYLFLARRRLKVRLKQSKGGLRTWQRMFRKRKKAVA